MKQHKWHKEILHWANGGEIESRLFLETSDKWSPWMQEIIPQWHEDSMEYRIKPQPKELVEDEVFEKFWNTKIISAVTGSIDHPMWGKIDKDITQAIFNYGRRYERESQKTNNTMSVRGLSPTRRDYSMATSPIQTFKAPTEPTHVKKPQYLYVYSHKETHYINYMLKDIPNNMSDDYKYIGKIQLEVEE